MILRIGPRSLPTCLIEVGIEVTRFQQTHGQYQLYLGWGSALSVEMKATRFTLRWDYTDLRPDAREVIDLPDPFEADTSMVPLLYALNGVGLDTLYHCSGHNEQQAYVSFRLQPWVRLKSVRNQALIIWQPGARPNFQL